MAKPMTANELIRALQDLGPEHGDKLVEIADDEGDEIYVDGVSVQFNVVVLNCVGED